MPRFKKPPMQVEYVGTFGQVVEGQMGGSGLQDREALGGPSAEARSPNPVSGAGPSNRRGLFHPNARKVANPLFTMVAGV